MILKSFQILAICTSMAVTPSNFHYEQPKKTYEENDFILDVPFESEWATGSYYSTGGWYQSYRKETGTAYNTAIDIKCYRTIETAHNGTVNSADIILPIESNIDNFTATNLLYEIQATPYKNIKNSRAQTRLDIRINNTIYVNPDTNENRLSLKYTLISSTDSYWAKYINVANMATINFNQNAYNDLTDATKGFTYNQVTAIRDLTTNAYQQQVFQNINVEIPTEQTSYIYILIQPYIRDYTSTPTVTIPGNSNWTYQFNGRNLLTFYGTEIISNVTTEVIDLPGVMFDILTMPFTFISIAFNLTLFAGTPYQINISNLFLSIIAMLVFIFIIRKILQR